MCGSPARVRRGSALPESHGSFSGLAPGPLSTNDFSDSPGTVALVNYNQASGELFYGTTLVATFAGVQVQLPPTLTSADFLVI